MAKKPRRPRKMPPRYLLDDPFSITIDGEPPSWWRAEWRALLDRALAAGEDALAGCLHPVARAYVEEAMTTVRKVRGGDLLDAALSPNTPKVIAAFMTLERFSSVPRLDRLKTKPATEKAAETHAPGIKARREKYQKALNGTVYSITTRGVAKLLADKCGVPLGTVKWDLAKMRGQLRRS